MKREFVTIKVDNEALETIRNDFKPFLCPNNGEYIEFFARTPSIIVRLVISKKLTIAPYSNIIQITAPTTKLMSVAIGFAARNIPIVLDTPLPPLNL